MSKSRPPFFFAALAVSAVVVRLYQGITTTAEELAMSLSFTSFDVMFESWARVKKRLAKTTAFIACTHGGTKIAETQRRRGCLPIQPSTHSMCLMSRIRTHLRT